MSKTKSCATNKHAWVVFQWKRMLSRISGRQVWLDGRVQEAECGICGAVVKDGRLVKVDDTAKPAPVAEGDAGEP